LIIIKPFFTKINIILTFKKNVIMAGLFSIRKDRSGRNKPRFADLDGNPLKEGDVVMSLRYDMGESRIINTDKGMVYESIKTGVQVTWDKMIDAATGNQKVRKLET